MQSTTGNREQARQAGRRAAARAAGAFVCAMAFAIVTTQFVPRARAQQDGVPADVAAIANQPRYTVEMIVFTYRTADSGNEIFVPDKPRLVPDPDDLAEAALEQNTYTDTPGGIAADPGVTDEPGNAAEEDARTAQREVIELQMLDPGQYTMDEVYRTLQRLDAYEPIMRAAWTQTTPPRETSPAVHLRALGEPPPGLDGSVTLYLGRYLHMVVDLALEAGGQQEMTATDRLIYGDDRLGQDTAPDTMLRMPVRYRIVEDRIMRSGETRYFDHPRFGVVARVTKPPEEPAQAGISRN